MSKHPNYFLAGLVDDRTTRQITKYRLKDHPPEIQSSTLAENLHVTIGYIGFIPDNDIEKIIQVYEGMTVPPPIPASLIGLGLYGGSNNHKKYFGLTVEDTAGLLQDLRDKSNTLLREKTLYRYQTNYWENFRPHITIQRLKRELTVPQMKAIQEVFLNQPFTPYSFFLRTIAVWFKNRATGYYEAVWRKNLE